MRYTVVFVLNIFKQTRDKHFISYNMFHVKLNYYEIIQLSLKWYTRKIFMLCILFFFNYNGLKHEIAYSWEFKSVHRHVSIIRLNIFAN